MRKGRSLATCSSKSRPRISFNASNDRTPSFFRPPSHSEGAVNSRQPGKWSGHQQLPARIDKFRQPPKKQDRLCQPADQICRENHVEGPQIPGRFVASPTRNWHAADQGWQGLAPAPTRTFRPPATISKENSPRSFSSRAAWMNECEKSIPTTVGQSAHNSKHERPTAHPTSSARAAAGTRPRSTSSWTQRTGKSKASRGPGCSPRICSLRTVVKEEILGEQPGRFIRI